MEDETYFYRIMDTDGGCLCETRDEKLTNSYRGEEGVKIFRVTRHVPIMEDFESEIHSIISNTSDGEEDFIRVYYTHRREDENGILIEMISWSDFDREEIDDAYDYAKQLRGILIPMFVGDILESEEVI